MTTQSIPIEEVCDWLNTSVTDVFSTMFSSEAHVAPPLDSHGTTEPLVIGSVGFVGKMNGVVYLGVTAAFARTLTSRMLGMPEAEIEGDEMVNDVIGELSNMIVGSVKSRLCDRGAPCVLTIPSILRGQNFEVQPIKPSERRLLGFQCGADHLAAKVILKTSE